MYPEYTNLGTLEELKLVLSDGKVIECVQSLLGELITRPLENTNAKASKAQYDLLMETLEKVGLIELCMGLASTLLMGNSIHEVVWEKVANTGQLLPKRVVLRDNAILRFRFESPSQGVLPYLWVRGKEFDIPPRKFIIARYWTIPNSDPYGNGLGEALYPLVMLRSQAIQDWGKFSSTYAEPVRVGTYPVNASDAEVAAFNGFVQALGKARAVTLPEGFKVDYVDPPKSTTGLQKDLYESINQDISLLILGEATAGKTDPGNKAKDQVSSSLRDVKAHLLGKLLTDTLNTTLVKWIQELNFPNEEPCHLDFKNVEQPIRQVSEPTTIPGSTDRS